MIEKNIVDSLVGNIIGQMNLFSSLLVGDEDEDLETASIKTFNVIKNILLNLVGNFIVSTSEKQDLTTLLKKKKIFMNDLDTWFKNVIPLIEKNKETAQ